MAPKKKKPPKQLSFGGMATREQLSRRAYARRKGVSESAVRKAIKDRRITVGASGKIDPIKADREWNASTDFTRPSSTVLRDVAGDGAGGLELTGRGSDPEMAKHLLAFSAARAARERVRAQIELKELQRLDGALIDKGRARAAVFSHTRRARDIVLGIPDRVVAGLTGIPGLDLTDIHRRVSQQCQLACAELAQPVLEEEPKP